MLNIRGTWLKDIKSLHHSSNAACHNHQIPMWLGAAPWRVRPGLRLWQPRAAHGLEGQAAQVFFSAKDGWNHWRTGFHDLIYTSLYLSSFFLISIRILHIISNLWSLWYYSIRFYSWVFLSSLFIITIINLFKHECEKNMCIWLIMNIFTTNVSNCQIAWK